MKNKITIQALFPALLFFGIFVFSLQPITDPDFWWHLKTGQMIWETGQIPHSDLYSFSAEGNPWIAHEWLSELIFFMLYSIGGQVLLICVFAALLTVLFFLCYLRCPAESKPFLAGFSLILGAAMSVSTWGVRPQVFSFLLASLFFFLLDKHKQSGKVSHIIPLPFLSLLWVNLHGAYILGLVLIAVYAGADVIDAVIQAIKNKTKFKISKSVMQLSGVFLACVLASLVNPNGIKMLIYPFQTITDPSISQYILEWISPDFHVLAALPLLAMFLILMGISMKSKEQISTVNLLLCLGFGYAVLHAVKQVTYFALVSIPVLSQLLVSVIPQRIKIPKSNRVIRSGALVIALCCGSILFAGISQLPEKQRKAESMYFPEAAVDWIAENKPEGNVFNAYNWGGYLIWRLYPEYRVYIDGRCDMYEADFLKKYGDIRQIRSGWQTTLEEEHINWVFIEKESYMAEVLKNTPNWQKVYEDDMSIIYINE
jgi:hypothetical protein